MYNCSLHIILCKLYICLYSHTPDSQTYILCHTFYVNRYDTSWRFTATLDGASFSRATIPESSIFGLPNVCKLRQHLASHKGPPRKDARIQFSKGFMYHKWCRIFFRYHQYSLEVYHRLPKIGRAPKGSRIVFQSHHFSGAKCET